MAWDKTKPAIDTDMTQSNIEILANFAALETTIGSALTGGSTLNDRIVQVVNYQTGAVATGTTNLPYDDTIPQKTEGTEFMTLAVTPSSATNKLKIEVVAHIGYAANGYVCAALFQDTTADALACGAKTAYATESNLGAVTFTHYMTTGTTSATTFKVRAGGSNGTNTYTFNGTAGARKFGGVIASSITITEIAV